MSRLGKGKYMPVEPKKAFYMFEQLVRATE